MKTQIKNWLNKLKVDRKIDSKKLMNTRTYAHGGLLSAASPNFNAIGSLAGASVSAAGSFGNIASLNAIQAGPGRLTLNTVSPIAILSIHGKDNQEIVRLQVDGSVVWADGIQVDNAAEAFANSLRMSAEIAAGINYHAKQRIRDTIFEDMISMAKEKGVLTENELTYLWQAAKIMDKLKGIK